MKCLRLPEQDLCPPRCLDRPECRAPRRSTPRRRPNALSAERPISGVDRASRVRSPSSAFVRQKRSRARGPTASGTRASPRGPRSGRGTRATRPPRDAWRRARLAAAVRTRRHARARARMRARALRLPTSAVARRRKPLRRKCSARPSPCRRSRCRARPSRRPSRRRRSRWRYAFSSGGRPSRRAR